jgi:hypothetical protein
VQQQAIGQQLADAKGRQAELKQQPQEHRKIIRKLDQQKSRQQKCARMCSKEKLLIILRGKETAEAAEAVPDGDLAAEGAMPDGDLVAQAAVPDGDFAAAAMPNGDLAAAAVPD